MCVRVRWGEIYTLTAILSRDVIVNFVWYRTWPFSQLTMFVRSQHKRKNTVTFGSTMILPFIDSFNNNVTQCVHMGWTCTHSRRRVRSRYMYKYCWHVFCCCFFFEENAFIYHWILLLLLFSSHNKYLIVIFSVNTIAHFIQFEIITRGT